MASVAVIDGGRLDTLPHYLSLLHAPAKILLTPFRHMVVPPPMAAQELLLSSPALMVSFAPTSRSNDFAVLLSDGSIAVFAYEKDNVSTPRNIAAPKRVGPARYTTTSCSYT